MLFKGMITCAAVQLFQRKEGSRYGFEGVVEAIKPRVIQAEESLDSVGTWRKLFLEGQLKHHQKRRFEIRRCIHAFCGVTFVK